MLQARQETCRGLIVALRVLQGLLCTPQRRGFGATSATPRTWRCHLSRSPASTNSVTTASARTRRPSRGSSVQPAAPLSEQCAGGAQLLSDGAGHHLTPLPEQQGLLHSALSLGIVLIIVLRLMLL